MDKEIEMNIKYNGTPRDLSRVLKTGVHVLTVQQLDNGEYRVLCEEKDFRKKAKITEEEKLAIIKDRESGMTIPECAKSHGVSVQKVNDILREAGLVRPREDHTQEILKMYDDGTPTRQISENLGISIATVYKALGRRDQYVPNDQKTKIAERNRKLAEEYAAGKDPKVLAKEYGLVIQTVYRIIRETECKCD